MSRLVQSVFCHDLVTPEYRSSAGPKPTPSVTSKSSVLLAVNPDAPAGAENCCDIVLLCML